MEPADHVVGATGRDWLGQVAEKTRRATARVILFHAVPGEGDPRQTVAGVPYAHQGIPVTVGQADVRDEQIEGNRAGTIHGFGVTGSARDVVPPVAQERRE